MNLFGPWKIVFFRHLEFVSYNFLLVTIQVFVETLDRCFENVCELDLIFHVDKVHYILQEIVMGGMVLETNMNEVIQRIEDQNKLEKVSFWHRYFED